MKTFEEVKQALFNMQSQSLGILNHNLEKARLENDKFGEGACKRFIEATYIDLNNIDECTAIYIGFCTNQLIESIKRAHDFDTLEYYKDFDAFLKRYILGDGIESFGHGNCQILGVGINDLECFRGCNPNKDEPGDLFRQIINVNYGTTIPMAADLRYVEQEQLERSENDKDLVYGKEVLRDAGKLYGNGNFSPLAVDQEYQEAKTRISGKTI